MEARRREHERHEEPERREAHLEPVEREREREAFGVEPRAFGMRDLIHWGPVWAGVIGGFATLILLAALGLAIGLAAVDPTAPGGITTGAAIWTAIILLVAYFVGGYVAGRTSSYRGTVPSAFIIGSMVWALGVVLTVLLASLGIAGALGTLVSAFGPTPPTVPPGQAVATAQTTAVWTFVFLVLSYIAALAGAYVGSRGMVGES
ncbi:MAG: hypothetical protein ACM3US_09465 [Sphingomonadaceae bacterium]